MEWLPRVFDYGHVNDWNWLLLEFVPNKWPGERRNFDVEALSKLRELHSVPVSPDTFDWADLNWTEDHLSVASRYLPAVTYGHLEIIYRAYLECAQKNLSLCSGDPNVPNWLLRDNGEIVLIDWQIVTRANRALDLAGWIATMPTFEQLSEIARIYLNSEQTAESNELARDIAIFFTGRCAMNFWRAEVSAHPELWQAGIDRLIRSFPDWIANMVAEVKPGKSAR